MYISLADFHNMFLWYRAFQFSMTYKQPDSNTKLFHHIQVLSGHDEQVTLVLCTISNFTLYSTPFCYELLIGYTCTRIATY